MECLTLRVEEAAKVCGIGRTAMYQAIRRGEIPHRRLGGLILISKTALQRWLEGDPVASTSTDQQPGE